MKANIKDLKSSRKFINVEIPDDIVSSEFDEVYKEIKRNAKVPGFRVGSRTE